jgi:chromate reductase
MHILGLSGSLRGDSHNTRLLRGARKLLPAGVELVVFEQLAAIPPYSEDDEHDVLVATPEYNASIPGVLKNALDWVSRPIASTPLRGKPVAVVGASTSLFGAVWAQAETRKVLSTIGAHVVDRELPIAHAEEALGVDGLPLERETVEELSATLDELLELASQDRLAA